MLYQLSFQANWEQVVMWVDDNHVDVEIGDDHTGIVQAFLAAAQAAQKMRWSNSFIAICISNTYPFVY